MLLYDLARGDAPLIVNVPHAGTHVPDAIGGRLTEASRRLPDTDWHVDRLYEFARDAGVTLLVATHSRYVVDLNRDPAGAALYPGDNTELVPSRTFANEPVYSDGEAPGEREIAARVVTFFAPYHAALAAEIARVRTRHGFVVLLDGHSIASRVPRFFAGRLPDLNLGTADGTSCDRTAQDAARQVLANAAGFTQVVNGRFKGGWITRRYGVPAEGVHALQLEMALGCYMGEAPPWTWDGERAQPLARVLERLVIALSEWRPPRR